MSHFPIISHRRGGDYFLGPGKSFLLSVDGGVTSSEGGVMRESRSAGSFPLNPQQKAGHLQCWSTPGKGEGGGRGVVLDHHHHHHPSLVDPQLRSFPRSIPSCLEGVAAPGMDLRGVPAGCPGGGVVHGEKIRKTVKPLSSVIKPMLICPCPLLKALPSRFSVRTEDCPSGTDFRPEGWTSAGLRVKPGRK